jgi:hypothetical protein
MQVPLWFCLRKPNQSVTALNFLLKNLEHELSDRHLVVGEKLLEEGKVAKLYENEHHLWIAEVDSFEVEIQISPSRVKAFSCECGIFEKECCCGHVAATLLLLRRQLSEQVREPKNKGNRAFQHQKLTTNTILDSITQDELAAFVRNYARSNKQFSIALRTKFAAKVPLADNVAKFDSLLESAIQTYRRANDRISATGAVQLKKLLEELLGQADDATALEHFAEAWAILSAVVARFSPILKKVETGEPLFNPLLAQAFQKQKELASHQIPPALRSDIRQFCEVEFNRPAYKLNGFSGKILETWILITKEKEELNQVLAAINRELARPLSDSLYRSQLMLAKWEILENANFKAEMEAFILEALAEPKILLQVVDAMETTGNFLRIKELVEKGHRLIPAPQIRERLQDVLFNIAQTEGRADLVTSIARQKFLETRDFEFYDQCKQHFKGDWELFVKLMLADLVARYDFRQQFPTIATILGREGKLTELLGLLEEQESLELLMQFDKFLLKPRPNDVKKLYSKMLKHYLVDHLGLVASKRLKAVLEHLNRRGADSIAEAVLVEVRQAYPQRRFYLEEEEGFQI